MLSNQMVTNKLWTQYMGALTQHGLIVYLILMGLPLLFQWQQGTVAREVS